MRAIRPLVSGLIALGYDPAPLLDEVGLNPLFGTFRATPRGGHEHMRLGLDEVRGRDAQRPLWLLGRALTSAPVATAGNRAEVMDGQPREKNALTVLMFTNSRGPNDPSSRP
jgi:hypothetical protein